MRIWVTPSNACGGAGNGNAPAPDAAIKRCPVSSRLVAEIVHPSNMSRGAKARAEKPKPKQRRCGIA
jgi:hypothetical protein